MSCTTTFRLWVAGSCSGRGARQGWMGWQRCACSLALPRPPHPIRLPTALQAGPVPLAPRPTASYLHHQFQAVPCIPTTPLGVCGAALGGRPQPARPHMQPSRLIISNTGRALAAFNNIQSHPCRMQLAGRVPDTQAPPCWLQGAPPGCACLCSGWVQTSTCGSVLLRPPALGRSRAWGKQQQAAAAWAGGSSRVAAMQARVAGQQHTSGAEAAMAAGTAPAQGHSGRPSRHMHDKSPCDTTSVSA
jgi:hypothetical protein